jgi:hypothetical protein
MQRVEEKSSASLGDRTPDVLSVDKIIRKLININELWYDLARFAQYCVK